MKGRFSLNLRNLGILTLAFMVLFSVLPLQVFAADTGGTATKLSPPANITTAIGDNTVTLMWNTVDGAISYNVFYNEAGGSAGEPIRTSETTAVIDGLNNGQEYEFRISSIGEAGEGELSNTIPATPEAPNPPSAPIIDQAVAGDSSIVVTWQRLTDSSVAGYFVYYKEQGHPDYIKEDAGMDNSFMISGLINGMNYDVAVAAYDDSVKARESELSDVLTATPQPGAAAAPSQAAQQDTIVKAAGSPITGLMATPGDKKADLTWTGLSGTPTYKIRYATTTSALPTDNAVIKTTTAGATSYQVTGLTNGTKYYFSVEESTDPTTRSVEEVWAIPQVDPTITFTAPVLDEALKHYTKDTGEVTIQGGCENTSSLTVNGSLPTTLTLSNGTGTFTHKVMVTAGSTAEYKFEATGVNSKVVTKTVTIVHDTTAPPEVTNLSGDVGDGQVTISWTYDPPADFAKYLVYSATSQEALAEKKNPAEVKAGDGQSCIVKGLTNGTMYWFAVTAVDKAGNESVIPTAEFPRKPTIGTSVSAPTGLAITNLDTKLKITWNAVSNAGAYKIYYGTTSTNLSSTIDVSKDVTSYEITGLTNGTTYYIAMTAFNSDKSKESDKTSTYSGIPSATTSNMSIKILVDKSIAYLGDTLTYTVEYKNSSSSALSGVKVMAYLPSNLSYIANSAGGTVTLSNSDKTLTWNISSMAASSIQTVSFKGTINSSSSGGTVFTKAGMTSDQIATEVTNSVTTTLSTAVAAQTASGNATGTESTTTGTDPANTVNASLPSSLPYTGMELRWYLLIAIALAAAGLMMLIDPRRKLRLLAEGHDNTKKRYLWTSRR